MAGPHPHPDIEVAGLAQSIRVDVGLEVEDAGIDESPAVARHRSGVEAERGCNLRRACSAIFRIRIEKQSVDIVDGFGTGGDAARLAPHLKELMDLDVARRDGGIKAEEQVVID